MSNEYVGTTAAKTTTAETKNKKKMETNMKKNL